MWSARNISKPILHSQRIFGWLKQIKQTRTMEPPSIMTPAAEGRIEALLSCNEVIASEEGRTRRREAFLLRRHTAARRGGEQGGRGAGGGRSGPKVIAHLQTQHGHAPPPPPTPPPPLPQFTPAASTTSPAGCAYPPNLLSSPASASSSTSSPKRSLHYMYSPHTGRRQRRASPGARPPSWHSAAGGSRVEQQGSNSTNRSVTMPPADAAATRPPHGEGSRDSNRSVTTPRAASAVTTRPHDPALFYVQLQGYLNTRQAEEKAVRKHAVDAHKHLCIFASLILSLRTLFTRTLDVLSQLATTTTFTHSLPAFTLTHSLRSSPRPPSSSSLSFVPSFPPLPNSARRAWLKQRLPIRPTRSAIGTLPRNK